MSNLEDMRAGRESGCRDRRPTGPGGGGYSPGSSLGSVRQSRHPSQPSSPHQHSYQMHPSGGLVQPTQTVGSVGSPNLFNSGIGGNGGNGGLSTNVAYLSPPLDPCFMKKRAHSDSTLHQAAMVSGEGVGNTSPNLSRRGAFEPYISLLKKSRHVFFLIILGQAGINYLTNMDPSNNSLHLGLGIQIEGRPKSCCDVSRVPGIKYNEKVCTLLCTIFQNEYFIPSIVPGPEPNGIQIPIGNNTGSLPDLTNLQFDPSPLNQSIDGDENSLQAHPLYSTVRSSLLCNQNHATFISIMQSPHVVSPSYGGNGLVSHTHPLNTLNMDLNPGPPGGSSRGSSPGPSPSQRRRPHHQLQNLQLSPRSQNHSQNQSSVSSFKIVFYIMRVTVKRNPKWKHDVIRYSVVCSIWHVYVSAFFISFCLCTCVDLFVCLVLGARMLCRTF